MLSDEQLVADMEALDTVLRAFGYMLALTLKTVELQVVDMATYKVVMSYDFAFLKQGVPASWQMFIEQAIALTETRTHEETGNYPEKPDSSEGGA